MHDYPARCSQAAAIMLMINNNLDVAVAQHPHELITYGNGAVFQNWAQYRTYHEILVRDDRRTDASFYIPVIPWAFFLLQKMLPGLLSQTEWLFPIILPGMTGKD